MTDNLTDRPAMLPSRSRPQPAPGRRDPMDPVPTPVAAPAPDVIARPVAAASRTDIAPAARRRRSEPLEQLNVRISSDVRDLADAASAAQGITLRQVIETAIRQQWG